MMKQVMLGAMVLGAIVALSLATYWPSRRPPPSPMFYERQSRTLPYQVQQSGYYQDSAMMSYVHSGSAPSHTSRSIIYASAPAFSHLMTPVTWSQRPIYTGMPIYTSYVSPIASSPSSFSKRFDQAQSSPESQSMVSSVKHKPCPFEQLASNQYPVYVLPPKNFQPIIYQQSNQFPGYLTPIPIVFHEKSKTKDAEELWYEAENEAILKPNSYQGNQVNKGLNKVSKKKIVLVPLEDSSVGSVPVFEATVVNGISTTQGSLPNSLVSEATREVLNPNPYNMKNTTGPVVYETRPKPKDNRRYKTKQPVGLSSFLLGGVRGVSGRHWQLPLDVTTSLEFMPNLSPAIEEPYYPESTKTSDEPSVNFENDQFEKEESSEEQPAQTSAPRSSFAGNSILDSEIDLEAQESSQMPVQAMLPTLRN